MKGIVYTKLGSPEVLKLMDVEKPIPNAEQVLIKVKASALNNLDYNRFINQINTAKTPFFTRFMDSFVLKAVGKVLGADVSGVIEDVGKNVTKFKKGDEVFGVTTGLLGGWAEYALVNETTICLKPSNLTFEQSAAIPISGITALGAVRIAKIHEKQSVLVFGTSGGVGQYAVQIAKAVGATVTAVCSTRNLEIAKTVGADFVIDYKNEDFTRNDKTYDVILGINGYNPIDVYKKMLNKGGTYVAVGGKEQGIIGGLLGPLYSIKGNKKMTASTYFNAIKNECLPYLKNIAEEGKIKPFIEKQISLQDIAEAIINIVKNHAQGKIIIKI